MDLEKSSIIKTTYSIADILEWQRIGTLNLQPFYQRRSVWNELMKSLLIDSLLRSYPIPLIFLHNSLDIKTSRTVRNVVDGQQRLRTILAFVEPSSLEKMEPEDRFAISGLHNKDYAGQRFVDLPDDAKEQILETQLSVNLLPANVQDVTILKMFQRLNSTGMKLSGQEHRNAQFSGPFKTLSYDLAYEQHHRWANWGIFKQSQIAQMLEVEFTSDLLGYLLRGVDASSKVAIDSLYAKYDDADSVIPDIENVSAVFRSACDILDQVFGSRQPAKHLKEFRTKQWVYATFANIADSAEAGHLPELDLDPILEDAQARLLARGKTDDDELGKVLRGATSHKASRKARIDFLASSFVS